MTNARNFLALLEPPRAPKPADELWYTPDISNTQETPMALTDHSQPAATTPDLRRIAALVAGDALAFLVFAAVGRASHTEAAGLDAILQVAGTAAPFALGWFIVAPLAGAFKAELAGKPRKM